MKRLRKTDFNRIQRSMKEKTDKEIETLTNLTELPDFDVTEFFQTLLKNQNYEEILERIPEEKKINFFSKNYQNFLETQEELLSLKLPELKEIPKAKEFHLKLHEDEEVEENQEENAVIELVDTFAANVLEKNIADSERIYKIICEMKRHSKYQQFFERYSINKILREAYIGFIENCSSVEKMLAYGQVKAAVKLFLNERQTQVFEKINTDLQIDSSMHSLKKSLIFLLREIEECSHEFKVKFREEILKEAELTVFLSKWIGDMSKAYYQSVEGFIFQEEELSSILKNLSIILDTSQDLESKGISLYHEMRNTISVDLPCHLQKIIEVILQSFESILKYSNELFEFVEISSNSNGALQTLLASLRRVSPSEETGKKCASQKSILMINSFYLILLPLCEEKWEFLHANVLDKIVDRVKGFVEEEKVQMPFWDYYHLFMFFYTLAQGRVRNKRLFHPENCLYIREKVLKVKKLGEECRVLFENKLINMFWAEVLSEVPALLWEFKKYAESPDRAANPKPTALGIATVFSLEAFFRQFEFRLSREHLDYLAVQLFEYVVFVFEYVLFWSYHEHGRNEKVFTLFKKQEKYLARAKEFAIEELSHVRLHKCLKISHFTKHGLERFVLDFYFLAEAYRLINNGLERIRADDFMYKVSKILAKELKNEPLETDYSKYSELLKQFIGVYQKQPEVMRKYLKERRQNSTAGFK